MDASPFAPPPPSARPAPSAAPPPPPPPAPRVAFLLPAHNAEATIAPLVQNALAHAPLVIVVDDGSSDATADAARAAGATVLAHVHHLGRAMSLFTGFDYARTLPLDFVCTLDPASTPSDLPAFLSAWRRTRVPLLLGNRLASASPALTPRRRRILLRAARALSRAAGRHLPDPLTPFRLVHASLFPTEPPPPADRPYAAEAAWLARLALRNVPFHDIPATPAAPPPLPSLADAIRFRLLLRRIRRERNTLQGT